jgi:uncharacterized ion transporter superfamily protein YfcC
MNKDIKQKKTIHPLIIICILVVVAALLTYIVPSGQFDRVVDENTGRTLVVADSYKPVESNPVSLGSFLLSFNNGIQGAANIIAFLMLIGGAFGVINSTGAISALMTKFIHHFKSDKSKHLLIIGLFAFFVICGGTFGMALEGLVFAPFIIMLMKKLGYDEVLGISIPVIGSAVGYATAYLNPGSLGIAQGIAELPFTSGIVLRLIFMVMLVVSTSIYFIRYAKKIKSNPELSCCYGNDYIVEENDITNNEMTNAQKRVLIVFGLGIVFLIYGTFFKSFFMAQASTLFLFMGIISGVVYGMKPGEIAQAYTNGVKDMALPCLIVGFARAITLMMESGLIMDTIVQFATLPLKNLSPLLSAPLMVIVQTIINFFINSGSAQAVVMMPLIVPISDILEVNRQVAVLAYQIGDGLSNMIWITSNLLLVGLGIARVSYSQWIKFALKLFIINLVIGMLVVFVAQLINWGPF